MHRHIMYNLHKATRGISMTYNCFKLLRNFRQKRTLYNTISMRYFSVQYNIKTYNIIS